MARLPAPVPAAADAPAPDVVADALSVAEAGTGALDASVAETLMHARGEHLYRLLAVASKVRDEGLRRAGRPGVVTYSRKVFLPLTRLCRDRCHYCVFVTTPGLLRAVDRAPYLTSEEVLAIAREGAELGCKEALLTLGDRPEDRWPAARKWLDDQGFESTLSYVSHIAELILQKTGLLPHLNPGVMSWTELQRLRPSVPSMGMMLETTAGRLWSEPGGPHYGSPDKDPALRLQVIEDAGRSRIPFTTGVLFGIGETFAERVQSILALRAAHARYGHLQEVIVQNFRAKPRTAMRGVPDLETEEYAAGIAVARLLLGPDLRLQAPPNLTDAAELRLLLRAGIDDWGGVSPLTPDHVNPERPWPHLDHLAELTAEQGFTLRERLTTHPHYLRAARTGADWVDDRLLPSVLAMADSYGLARDDHRHGTAPMAVPAAAAASGAFSRLLDLAADDPAGLSDAAYVELLHADGVELDGLTALANVVRRTEAGEAVTFAINRNLDSSLPLPSERVADLAREAAELGATEICAQGAVPVERGADGYLEFARAVKHGCATLHLHAFRPAELRDGADRAAVPLPTWLGRLHLAGVDTVPGTGARILDDRIRAALTAGSDIDSDDWVDTVTAAHTAGLRSTATMVYGHLETAVDQVGHLRRLLRIHDETAGFTELILMPWLPIESPVPVPGARPGPTLRESRALHAVARLMLAGRIAHLQAAWTKLGLRGAQVMLTGGADDLGGVLLDGELDPAAGPEAGRQLRPRDVVRLAEQIGRPARQRTTVYGEVARDGDAHLRG